MSTKILSAAVTTEIRQRVERLDDVIAEMEVWLSMNEKLLEDVEKKGGAVGVIAKGLIVSECEVVRGFLKTAKGEK